VLESTGFLVISQLQERSNETKETFSPELHEDGNRQCRGS
jgi:hypothetical protein